MSERLIARVFTVLGVPALLMAVWIPLAPLVLFFWLPGFLLYRRIVRIAFQSAWRYEPKPTWIPTAIWNLLWVIVYSLERSPGMVAYSAAFVILSVLGYRAAGRGGPPVEHSIEVVRDGRDID